MFRLAVNSYNSISSTFCLALILFLFAINVSASPEVFSHLDNEPIIPIPPIPSDIDPELVQLGKKLFREPRLSANNTIACINCHVLSIGGVDGTAVSIGINGKKGKRNAPSVFNSSLHSKWFWDGSAKSLEEQIGGPIHNPVEMGSDWPEVIKKLSNDPEYVKDFLKLYDSAITKDNITHAISTFERTLLTPDSPFDRYLKGDITAIDKDTADGYRLFKSYGCASCHQGALVGGNMFEKIGIAKPFDWGSQNDKNLIPDYGRFHISGEDEHKFEFKVPSLRNVELTAPYFHNGTVKTLEEAVKLMGEYQLGRHIPDKDVVKIVLFLRALTGQHPELNQ
ncbi:MAG: cytochrome-c peroxidase [Gammaproteobacteria bacterium]|nr:cytochrome-c peroxidase [Gammaproteobacteria bacterium]